MAALAKQAMRKSFIHLLNEKPYHQITVKEIVEDCGLNRNTFYYYFHDLNELLETTMNDIVQQIVRAHPTLASVEACADALMEVILENRQAVLHLYHSEQRPILERYLWHINEYLVKTYLNQLSYYCNLKEVHQQLLVDYLQSLFFGMTLHWLESGLNPDEQMRLRQIFAIHQQSFFRQISLIHKSEN